jgi:hypothetical protein
MGFFKNLADSISKSLTGRSVGRPADAVDGTANITAATGPHERSSYSQGRFHAVIQAPGIPAFPVEFTKIVSSARWPFAGTVLPCWVSASDPSNYAIDFDSMPTHRDQARQQAEAQAAMMRGEWPDAASPSAGGVPGLGGIFAGGAQVQFVGGSPSDLPPEKLAKLETMLGTDLNGDGIVGASPSSAPPNRPGVQEPAQTGTRESQDDPDDRIRRLSELHELHTKGALTAEEFEIEKRRILG